VKVSVDTTTPCPARRRYVVSGRHRADQIGSVVACRVHCTTEDDRHALVELADSRVGRGCDDGARLEDLVFLAPRGPEAGQGQNVAVPGRDEPGLLVVIPLVEAVGGEEVAAAGERFPEEGAVQQGLGPGVNPGVAPKRGSESRPGDSCNSSRSTACGRCRDRTPHPHPPYGEQLRRPAAT
jgi:hypothetical protein